MMSAGGDEIGALDAASLARLVGQGAIAPREIVSAALERIQRIDPQLNFISTLDSDGAFSAATQAEDRLARGEAARMLEGVPVVIKDLTPTRGLRTTSGSRVYRNHIPDRDAIVVERLRAAGAIVIAKTTTSEFANASVTESPLTGITRNPWNARHMSGGSSGGSAVAVATGCVPLGEGSDMGGSVRIPASFCGIVGLKPSLGRIPFAVLPNLFDPMAHHGPLARTVEDAALFLNATAGPDDRDPLSLPSINRPFGGRHEIAGLRAALSLDLGCQSVDRDVAANTIAMARRLEELGVCVEEVDPGLDDQLYTAGYRMFAAQITKARGHLVQSHRADLDPTLLRFFEIAKDLTADDLMEADLVRSHHWRRFSAAMEGFDLLVCPTMPRSAPSVGHSEFDFEGRDTEGRSISFDMTLPFNLFGQLPAISIPSGLDRAGLPTGLQVVGRRHDEDTILAVAAALHDRDFLSRMADF